MSRDGMLKLFLFSFYTTMSVIVSFFPLYFRSQGYSTVQIGLLYSVGPMIGIVSTLFWGVMSDRLRTVKKVLIIVLTGQLVMASLAFQTGTFGLLMLLMAGFYFFQSPMTSLNDSLTLLTISGTKKSYASFRVWGSIGFAAGALVFGQLLERLGPGWTAPLTMGSIACTLLLACLLFDAKDASVSRPDFSGLVPIVASRPFLAFLGVVLALSVSHRMNDGFLALFLKAIGADDAIVGWSWMVSAVSEIPIFFLLSKYGHKFKELPLLAVSALVYGIRFLVMSLIDNPLWVVACQCLHSVSFGIFLFTAIRYIQRIVPDRYRASGQAVFAVTWSGLAGLLSGLMGGWLFNAWSPHAVYGAAAALALAAMIGFIALHAMGSGDDAVSAGRTS
ncbi:MFS transporter [Paenibacillus ginsengihumi]|uniref:MFS transporter n=1 Tax=Paenibacillus ginsengihumi TaxID=431596 RepID=UPI000367214E|nr:MFS transporter [Paenibacillus ginsengihumi]